MCDTQTVFRKWPEKTIIHSLLDRLLESFLWYDTSELKWGDSLRHRIDEGLKRSKFGIAIISPNYIAEGKYWTKEEFNALFQLESINGKVLLPIWHNITKQEVMNFSPMVADKKAMTTAKMTSKEIAYELAKLLEVDIND